MKRLMVLGGSSNQVPLIRCAKQQGYYVVLCDYSEHNIGRGYADVFYCVSTLDKEAVLDAAERENIDGIVTNSEPAMPTCAYVGNKLGLTSNPYESVVTLSRKDFFREFLSENGFNCPQFCTTDNLDDALDMTYGFEFPLMVKPVDSSGSRGVTRIESREELEVVFDMAISFSKKKRVMIEEYIKSSHNYMIGGDIFVLDGKVAFWGLMNSMRDYAVSEFVPVGTSFPSYISHEQFGVIKRTIEGIIDVLGITAGPFNLELMFDTNNRLFVIEMNPRNGGNKIPELLKMATGVDLVKANIEASLGTQSVSLGHNKEGKYISTYVLHSSKDGILKSIRYDDSIRGNVLEIDMYKEVGDRVERFNNAEKLLGIVVLKFDSLDEMQRKLSHITELIEISVESDLAPI